MSADEHSEYRLETELRDGKPWTTLIIETEIPDPPVTHIDKEMLQTVVEQIKKTCLDQGKTFDEVRVVHRRRP